MKKLLATALAGAMVTVVANGQGTVNFKNYFTGTTSDPILCFQNGDAVYGSQYRVGLYAGPTANSLTLVATTTFITPGYFMGPAVAIPGVAGGATGSFQVVAWDSTLGGTTTGATYEEAFFYAEVTGRDRICGFSDIFTNPTGNPDATPPGLPADLVNMTGFHFITPEPSFPALAALASVLVCARRSQHRTLRSHLRQQL